MVCTHNRYIIYLYAGNKWLCLFTNKLISESNSQSYSQANECTIDILPLNPMVCDEDTITMRVSKWLLMHMWVYYLFQSDLFNHTGNIRCDILWEVYFCLVTVELFSVSHYPYWRGGCIISLLLPSLIAFLYLLSHFPQPYLFTTPHPLFIGTCKWYVINTNFHIIK